MEGSFLFSCLSECMIKLLTKVWSWLGSSGYIFIILLEREQLSLILLAENFYNFSSNLEMLS